MASETYHKVGRGGAGNYYSPRDIEEATKRSAKDLEAQPLPTTTTTSTSTSTLQDYAHSGRGGAGNFYSPATLQSTGTFANSATSTHNTHTDTHMNLSDGTAPPSAKESGSSEPAYYGRGGAGNFRVGEEAERRKKGEEEEREKRERVGEMVRRDVEAGLRRPEGAYLGGKVRLEE